jgi:hypothetical protein
MLREASASTLMFVVFPFYGAQEFRMAKKKQPSKREMRNLRIQQVVFILVSLMIVLAMVLSLIKF